MFLLSPCSVPGVNQAHVAVIGAWECCCGFGNKWATTFIAWVCFTITARRIWFFPLESDGIATLGLFCVSRDAFSFSTGSKAPSEDRFSFLPLSEDRRTFFSLKGLFPSWVSVFKEMFPPPPSEVEELRSLSTYFFFFFWETFLHYSPVRSPLVYYSMVICAVLHHLYSSFNCTGLSIIWTSLHPCIAICIPNFRTFNNIYIFDFLLS